MEAAPREADIGHGGNHSRGKISLEISTYSYLIEDSNVLAGLGVVVTVVLRAGRRMGHETVEEVVRGEVDEMPLENHQG